MERKRNQFGVRQTPELVKIKRHEDLHEEHTDSCSQISSFNMLRNQREKVQQITSKALPSL